MDHENETRVEVMDNGDLRLVIEGRQFLAHLYCLLEHNPIRSVLLAMEEKTELRFADYFWNKLLKGLGSVFNDDFESLKPLHDMVRLRYKYNAGMYKLFRLRADELKELIDEAMKKLFIDSNLDYHIKPDLERR